ncbi:unnamed protein product [Spirodela intermedia]|uniref:Uncharacterized protein n=1 Tax=Spirodela intermedia TaxID=51605 RepID=A0A7I8KPD1_SPIIN|nr:unnamed protein product [Spirodela intermedia]
MGGPPAVAWSARVPLPREGGGGGTPRRRALRPPVAADGISAGERFARAYAAGATRDGPRPEPSGGPASPADRLPAVPHPAGAHRRPPSASLPTISSTL